MKLRDAIMVCKGPIYLVTHDNATMILHIPKRGFTVLGVDKIMSMFNEQLLESEVEDINICESGVFSIRLKDITAVEKTETEENPEEVEENP